MKSIKSPKNITYTYNIQDELGSGAFGSVYKGINQTSKEIVAIKIVNIEKLRQQYKTDEIVRAVGREVNILQRITYETDNTYIVKIMDCCKVDGFVYIMLEYCGGGSL